MKKSMKSFMVLVFIIVLVLNGCSRKNSHVKETDSDGIDKEMVYDEPIQISIDSECTIDLNNDGDSGTVIYTLSSKEPYDGNITSFKVNGVEYVDKLIELGIYMNNPNWEWYYIVDIDESDNFKEIAILDEGPSDDPETYFIRFDGNKLQYIGSITDFPQKSSCQFNGDGTIVASSRLNILQTWWAPATWRIDENGLLQKVKDDMYYPYDQSDKDSLQPILLKDFMIYTEPNIEAKQVMVSANNQVTFKSTDNIHWVFMRSEDGTEGWFYMENFSGILYEGKVVESTSIFDNLSIYD